MKKLLLKLEALKAGREPGRSIKKRIRDFEVAGKGLNSEIFRELCFCLLTANYTAEGGIRIQNTIGGGFGIYTEKRLARELKKLGHRFPNARAAYIRGAQKQKDKIGDVLSAFDREEDAREWLVSNIKGLGYKEASHFMRNIGYKNVGIVDFHIIDLLSRHGLVSRPKTLTKSKYLEFENVLKKISDRTGMTLAELDLYLWFIETGKVLK